MKKLFAIFIALSTLLCLTSCNGGDGADTGTTASSTEATTTYVSPYDLEIIKDGATDYYIVYSLSGEKYAHEAAKALSNKIFEATGVRILVIDDLVRATGPEIILGKTKRDGNGVSFDRNGYNWSKNELFVGHYDSNILITAENDFELYKHIDAVADIWTSYFKDGVLGINNTIEGALMLSPANANPNVISIMTHNIYYQKIDERKELVKQELLYLQPDLFGAQEAKPAWIEFLDKELSGYGRIGVSRSKDGKGEYTPIYYKKDKFNLIDSGTFWLSNTPNVVGSRFEGANNDRIATWGLFEIKATGKKLLMLNTHLDTASEEIRTLELELIFEFLKDYDKYPIYMTGDFNFQRHFSTYSLMTSEYRDCEYLAESQMSKGVNTFNGFGNNNSMGDYVFTDSHNSNKIICHKVINEKRFGDFTFDGYVSDHYAVYIKTHIT